MTTHIHTHIHQSIILISNSLIEVILTCSFAPLYFSARKAMELPVWGKSIEIVGYLLLEIQRGYLVCQFFLALKIVPVRGRIMASQQS